jgi:lipopolysaccharide export LptBFGC system permease protein LptF
MAAVFVSLPAAAQAMCLSGSGAGCCAARHGGLLAGAAYAVVATLGYWVLLQAVKETSTCIKSIGDVLGSVLVIVGLLGLLCAVTGHIRSSLGRCCGGPAPAAMMAAPNQGQAGKSQ